MEGAVPASAKTARSRWVALVFDTSDPSLKESMMIIPSRMELCGTIVEQYMELHGIVWNM